MTDQQIRQKSSVESKNDPLLGHDTYETVKPLSKGSYGSVFLARDRNTGDYFALKFIKRGASGNGAGYIRREIVNHMKLRHPHVISLYEVFLTQEHLVLVMEYARCGDLFGYVYEQKGLPESESRWFFQQIVLALDYCHRMGVCLRDIKLENTLLDGPENCRPERRLVKLCDFGFSKHAELDSAPESLVGTPAYLAPEIITRISNAISVPGNSIDENNAKAYDGTAADIWSLGVLLYAMVTGTYPFQPLGDGAPQSNQALNDLCQRITKAEFSFPDSVKGEKLTEEFRHFVSTMLVRNPSERSTLKQIMEHPWFTKGLSQEQWKAAMKTNDDQVLQEINNPAVSPEIQEEIRLLVEEAQIPYVDVIHSFAKSDTTGPSVPQHHTSNTEFSNYEEQIDNMVLEGSSLGFSSVDNGSAMLEQI